MLERAAYLRFVGHVPQCNMAIRLLVGHTTLSRKEWYFQTADFTNIVPACGWLQCHFKNISYLFKRIYRSHGSLFQRTMRDQFSTTTNLIERII